MTSRTDLLQKALINSKQALANAPYMFPLESVIDQLQYLVDLDSGNTSDRSKLESIMIGQIAARDIEDFDSDLAELLHDVSALVRTMINGN